MNLHSRKAASGQGIADRNAGVGVSGWIDQNPGKFRARAADTVHDLAFVIALEDLKLYAERPGFPFKRFIDLFQRDFAIDRDFPLPQELQIWTMDHKNFFHKGMFSNVILNYSFEDYIISISSTACFFRPPRNAYQTPEPMLNE